MECHGSTVMAYILVVAVSVAFYDRDQPQPTGVSSYFINVAPNPAQIDLKTAVIAV